MKYSQEEILKALHVIKETCEENECGDRCPFNGVNVGCLISDDAPIHWKINDPPVRWKGLL